MSVIDCQTSAGIATVTERMRAVDRVLDPFNKRAGGVDHYHEPTSNR